MTIVIIYIITVISQLSRFVDSRYDPIVVKSLVTPDREVLTCKEDLANWVCS